MPEYVPGPSERPTEPTPGTASRTTVAADDGVPFAATVVGPSSRGCASRRW